MITRYHKTHFYVYKNVCVYLKELHSYLSAVCKAAHARLN